MREDWRKVERGLFESADGQLGIVRELPSMSVRAPRLGCVDTHLVEQPVQRGSLASGSATRSACAGFIVYSYSSKDADRQAVLLVNAGDDTMAHEDNGALQHVLESAYCTDRTSGR